MSADDDKKAVGRAAAALVQDGMIVGLGTGSTAVHFVDAVAHRMRTEGLKIRGVPTSKATEAQALSLDIPLIELDAAGEIDLTVDGADEIGPGLALIKGGGGAHLREKLVWEASRRCVVIADGGKKVARLGKFPLPVEVAFFGHATTQRRLIDALAEADIAAAPRLRMKDGQPYVTDNGGLIYDIPCGEIRDPSRLANALKTITGVVEHGLFLGLADEALLGAEGVVERLTP